MNILVVDDEPDICDCLTMLLEMRGHSATKAYSGLEGLTAVGNESYDLIISDIRMPDCDGIEFIEHLKCILDPLPPFIFMSGFSELSSEDVINSGATALVKKPISFNDLIKIIEEHGLASKQND
jgi:two-component system, NtrC family, sensor kinase